MNIQKKGLTEALNNLFIKKCAQLLRQAKMQRRKRRKKGGYSKQVEARKEKTPQA